MARKEQSKSALENQRLNYEVEILPLLKSIQNTYWKDDKKNIKLLAHETQHSPPLRVGVMFSGGPAPGGLNVLWGLYQGLKQTHSESSLIGFFDGALGFLQDRSIEFTDEMIDNIKNQGGFTLIGTGREKIESEDQLTRSIEVIKANRLQGLVFIGGDDTNTNAYHLSKYLEKEKIRCSIVGIPKTIDGDLKGNGIEASFGFDTATKTYSNMIGNLAKDAISCGKYWFFVKLMGRSASHVTLECALQTKPNLAFISEEISKKKTSFTKIIELCAKTVIERSQNGKNYGVVLIPEGLIEACFDMKEMINSFNQLKKEGKGIDSLTGDGKELFLSLPLTIQKQFDLDLDPHGNMKLSQIATDQLMADMVEERVKSLSKVDFKAVPIFYGYDGRCALPSNFDATYCYNLGLIAAILVRDRKTGYMATIKDLNTPVGEWSAVGIPLANMMKEEIRNGELKLVIEKQLVNLSGYPFKEFSKRREKWRLEDHYESVGPIQFTDIKEGELIKTKTLEEEQKKRSFL